VTEVYPSIDVTDKSYDQKQQKKRGALNRQDRRFWELFGSALECGSLDAVTIIDDLFLVG